MVLALISCFDKTPSYYNFTNPTLINFCTYKIYKTNLANLCQEHNIPLNHHDARSDAKRLRGVVLKSLKY
jgi:DNA polymerase-3 subunit epsilon